MKNRIRKTIPRHVAFILDGNRRYARSHGLGSVVRGHSAGFDRLTHVLDWCRELGIQEVTLYAFSIENFKRSKEEVGGLLGMAKQKFEKLLRERQKLEEKQICFRFFGRLELLPIELQKLMAEIEEITKDFKRGFVNVCLAYTSRAEVTAAMNDIRKGVEAGLIEEDDVDEALISQCLDTRKSIPIEMLIRTSGEHRLSDFLLWQCSNCYIHFEDVLWPEFNFWHLLKAVYGFQQNYKGVEAIESSLSPSSSEISSKNKKNVQFLEWLETERSLQRQILIQK
uniref:Alkyl transferase n=1 Tax=Panagrolaimus superbus TaxID=310955 RepID=A0A914Z3X0_9BILA